MHEAVRTAYLRVVQRRQAVALVCFLLLAEGKLDTAEPVAPSHFAPAQASVGHIINRVQYFLIGTVDHLQFVTRVTGHLAGSTLADFIRVACSLGVFRLRERLANFLIEESLTTEAACFSALVPVKFAELWVVAVIFHIAAEISDVFALSRI